jgi:hypothetical protein
MNECFVCFIFNKKMGKIKIKIKQGLFVNSYVLHGGYGPYGLGMNS